MSEGSINGVGTYNSLKDPNLAGYFSNNRTRKFLMNQGLITKQGGIISDAAYREQVARDFRSKELDDNLARSIVHKALDQERMRQVAIRDKMQEISRLKQVKRLRQERDKRRMMLAESVVNPNLEQSESPEKLRSASSGGLRQRKKQQPNRIRVQSAKNPGRKFITELELHEKDKQQDNKDIVIREGDSDTEGEKKAGDEDEDHHSVRSQSNDRSEAESARSKSLHSSLRSTSLDDGLRQRESDSPHSARSGDQSGRSRSQSPSTSRSAEQKQSKKHRDAKSTDEKLSNGRQIAPKSAGSTRPNRSKKISKRAELRAYRSMLDELLAASRLVAFMPKPPEEKRDGQSRAVFRKRRNYTTGASGALRSKSAERRRKSPARSSGHSSPSPSRLTSRLPKSALRYRTLCTVKLRFNGIRKFTGDRENSQEREQNVTLNDRHLVVIEQQPSGGNTMEVYRGYLYPNSEFEFVSQRRRDFPLGLSIDVDGRFACRVSQCCEMKRRIGSKFGTGQFTLVSVVNPIPCYKCRFDQQEASEKKQKREGRKHKSENLGGENNEAQYDDEFEADEDGSASRREPASDGQDERAKDNETDNKKADDKMHPVRLNVNNLKMTLRGNETNPIRSLLGNSGNRIKDSNELTLTITGSLLLDQAQNQIQQGTASADSDDGAKKKKKKSSSSHSKRHTKSSKSDKHVRSSRNHAEAASTDDAKEKEKDKSNFDAKESERSEKVGQKQVDAADVDTLSMVSDIRSEQVTPSHRSDRNQLPPLDQPLSARSASAASNANASATASARSETARSETARSDTARSEKSTRSEYSASKPISPRQTSSRAEDRSVAAQSPSQSYSDSRRRQSSDPVSSAPVSTGVPPVQADKSPRLDDSEGEFGRNSPLFETDVTEKADSNAKKNDVDESAGSYASGSEAEDGQVDAAAAARQSSSPAKPAIAEDDNGSVQQEITQDEEEAEQKPVAKATQETPAETLDKLQLAGDDSFEQEQEDKSFEMPTDELPAETNETAISPRTDEGKPITNDIDQNPDTVEIEIGSIVFRDQAAVLSNNLVQKVFVEFRFLNVPSEQLETSPMPKPKESDDPVVFRFRRTLFVDRESNFRRREHLAAMLLGDEDDVIPFYVTSEVDEDIGDCEDVAIGKVSLRDLLDGGADYENHPVVLTDPGDNSVVGTLYVTIKAVSVLRKIAAEFPRPAPPSVPPRNASAVASPALPPSKPAASGQPTSTSDQADMNYVFDDNQDSESEAEEANGNNETNAAAVKNRRKLLDSSATADAHEDELEGSEDEEPDPAKQKLKRRTLQDRRGRSYSEDTGSENETENPLGAPRRSTVTFNHLVEERVRTATETEASEYSAGAASDTASEQSFGEPEQAQTRDQNGAASVARSLPTSSDSNNRSASAEPQPQPTATQLADQTEAPSTSNYIIQDDANVKPQVEEESQDENSEEETEVQLKAAEPVVSPKPVNEPPANLPEDSSSLAEPESELPSQAAQPTSQETAEPDSHRSDDTKDNIEEPDAKSDDEDQTEEDATVATDNAEPNASLLQFTTSSKIIINDESLLGSDQKFKELLHAIEQNAGVETLALDGLSTLDNNRLDQILGALAANSSVSTLQQLKIDMCQQLTPEVGSLLGRYLPSFKNLVVLELATVNLGDPGVEDLVNSISAYFSRCEDDDEGDIYNAFKLRSLILNSCKVGDAGVRALAELMELDSPIDTLHLIGCKPSVTTDTWSKFSAALVSCTELSALDISDCMLGEEKMRIVLDNLKQNKSLRFLGIRSNLCQSGADILELIRKHSMLMRVDYAFGNSVPALIAREIDKVISRKAGNE